MRSSVVTVREVPEGSGFVVAGVLPANLDPAYPFVRYVLHVEPGRDPNEFSPVQTIVDGRANAWSPAVVAALWPNGSKHVLEAEYELNGERGRCKVADVPAGAAVIETNLVGHLWAGDE